MFEILLVINFHVLLSIILPHLIITLRLWFTWRSGWNVGIWKPTVVEFDTCKLGGRSEWKRENSLNEKSSFDCDPMASLLHVGILWPKDLKLMVVLCSKHRMGRLGIWICFDWTFKTCESYCICGSI